MFDAKKAIERLEYAWEYIRERPNPVAGTKAFAMDGIRKSIELLKDQEPETGCWVHGHCSCCGEDIGSKLDTWTNIQQFLFCPKCGAKMLKDE